MLTTSHLQSMIECNNFNILSNQLLYKKSWQFVTKSLDMYTSNHMHRVTILDLYHIFNAFAWESSWEIPVYTNVLFNENNSLA